MKTEDIKNIARAWQQVQEASKKNEASDTQMGTITVKTDAEREARAKAYRDKKAKNEELKGNQHKIDHNKDGKISAADFKGLRKKAKKDQEVEVQTSEETVNELSKKTLGSYIKKASDDKADNAYNLGAKDPLGKKGSWRKSINRRKGIEKAADRLAKEEVKMESAEWPIYKRLMEKDAHTKGATPPEEMDSKASGKEKEFRAKHKTDTVDNPEASGGDIAKATNAAPSKKARPGDNPQSDKMQKPVDTTK